MRLRWAICLDRHDCWSSNCQLSIIDYWSPTMFNKLSISNFRLPPRSELITDCDKQSEVCWLPLLPPHCDIPAVRHSPLPLLVSWLCMESSLVWFTQHFTVHFQKKLLVAILSNTDFIDILCICFFNRQSLHFFLICFPIVHPANGRLIVVRLFTKKQSEVIRLQME